MILTKIIDNDICENFYSNTELGIKARSLTIEDIEENFSDAGISARNSFKDESKDSGKILYGGTKTYGSGKNTYPTLYAQEAKSGVNSSIRTGGIGRSDPFYSSKEELSKAYDSNGTVIETSEATASGNLMVTQTWYKFDPAKTEYFEDNTFFDMIFGTDLLGAGETKTTYWLASRFTHCYSVPAGFGIMRARVYEDRAVIGGNGLFFSQDSDGNDDIYLRPVVSLGSELTITTTGEGAGNGTSTSPYQITQK